MPVLNAHFSEYERLLVQLHVLMAEGKSGSPEALSIREQMEVPEAHLTPEEIEQLNALSGDLYMLQDAEIVDASVTMRVPVEQLPLRVKAAFENESWKELLALLRTKPAFLDAVQVAYVRSRCFDALGMLRAAVAFMDDAARRQPDQPNYPSLAMEILLKAGRFEEAISRARKYLERESAAPRLVIMSAGVVVQCLRVTSISELAAKLVPLTVSKLDAVVAFEKKPVILFAGFGYLGLLARFERRIPDATKAFDAAIHAGRNLPASIAAIGLLAHERQLLSSGSLGTADEDVIIGQIASALMRADSPERLAA